MSIATEVVYVDGTTAVSAAWLNLIQEHLAGWINLRVTAAGQVVTIGATADDGAASVYVNGQQRVNESDITFTFTGAEATDTFDVYVVGDGGGDTFTMEVVSGVPAGTNTRKVAEVDYDTTLDEITELRIIRGEIEDHEHTALSGAAVVDHADLSGLTAGDPHTQYILVDGSRAFTGKVVGVYPVASSDIATKSYVDDKISSGVPVGSVVPYGGSTAPTGWLLCDGTSYADATYPLLAAALNDEYGGDASNFNVPDLRGVFPFGKPTAGTGSSLGDTGGSRDHTHTQPTHTHSESAHSHAMTAHTHTNSITTSNGAHTHGQYATSTDPGHTHSQPAHTHNPLTLAVSDSGASAIGARHASSTTIGAWPENDLDNASDDTNHFHTDGTYQYIDGGLSGSSTYSHSHYPTGNAHRHTHTSGAVGGTTDSGGAGTTETGIGSDHYHTNPTSSSSGAHTHTLGATTSALTTTNANTPGTTSAAGGDTTGSNNPPFQAVQYIVKHD